MPTHVRFAPECVADFRRPIPKRLQNLDDQRRIDRCNRQLVDGLGCGGKYLLATACLLERAAPLIAMNDVFPASLVGPDVSLCTFKEGHLLGGCDAFSGPLSVSFESWVWPSRAPLGPFGPTLGPWRGSHDRRLRTPCCRPFEDWIGESNSQLFVPNLELTCSQRPWPSPVSFFAFLTASAVSLSLCRLIEHAPRNTRFYNKKNNGCQTTISDHLGQHDSWRTLQNLGKSDVTGSRRSVTGRTLLPP